MPGHLLREPGPQELCEPSCKHFLAPPLRDTFYEAIRAQRDLVVGSRKGHERGEAHLAHSYAYALLSVPSLADLELGYIGSGRRGVEAKYGLNAEILVFRPPRRR